VKKILFLALHRPDRSPSQRYRFEQYFKYLNEEGFTYDFSFLISEKDDKVFYSEGNVLGKALLLLKSVFKILGQVLSANRYDIIFIQRECFMLGTSIFERLLSLSRAKIVFDFDDSIWLQNVSEANKKFSWLKNPNKTAQIIKLSHLIIAGNEYLAHYAKQYNSNVVIIPTTVDTDVYKNGLDKNKDSSKPICIGWSGSITTIQHFEFAVPFLEKLKDKFGDKVIFTVIGDETYENAKLGVKGKAWKKETEVKELMNFDIGIMPLPDNEWTKGKCGLKGLLFMSLEIPTIMSPVGVNAQIIKDGENGLLADDHEEWINKLSQLIEFAELRKSLGIKGRKMVLENYSCHANKSKYINAFKSLC